MYPVVAPKILVEKYRSIHKIDVKSSLDYDWVAEILYIIVILSYSRKCDRISRVVEYTTTFCSIEILSQVYEAGFLMEVSTLFSPVEKQAKTNGNNIFRQCLFHVDPFFKTSADILRSTHKNKSGGHAGFLEDLNNHINGEVSLRALH